MKKLLPIVMLICTLADENSLQAQWVQTNGAVGDYIRCFAVSDTNLFAGANVLGEGVFLSTNNGTSWTAVDSGLINLEAEIPAVNALAISGTDLFAGTSGGLFRSTNNGKTWVEVDSGLISSFYPDVTALVFSGTNLFAATELSVGLSTNDGTSWTAVDSGLSSPPSGVFYGEVISLAVSPNGVGGTNLFAGSGTYGIFLSTNNGTSWTVVDSGLTGEPTSAIAISGKNIVANSHGKLFLSTNNGTSWTAIDSGLTSGDNATISCFAVSGTNLFAGSSSYGVFLSTDSGISWAAVNTGLTSLGVNSLAVSGTNLFAGTSGGVWRRSLSEMITSVKNLITDLPMQFDLARTTQTHSTQRRLSALSYRLTVLLP